MSRLSQTQHLRTYHKLTLCLLEVLPSDLDFPDRAAMLKYRGEMIVNREMDHIEGSHYLYMSAFAELHIPRFFGTLTHDQYNVVMPA